jgi:nitric oxide reductase NorQ protein
MLTGPTGTGKTDVIIRICKALDIPCRIYDMGAMMDPLTDLLGSHRLENGSSKFDYAKFVKDIQEPGVILLDELSRARVMTNNILFPCLDDRRMLPVEIADSNGPREIPVHPECTFIATANIGSEYSGTNSLDIALENRFMIIQVDYLPKSFETKVLNIRTGIAENVAEKIVNVANAIRARYLDNSISKTISTRETLGCAELVVDGFSLMDAINFAFCEKFMKTGDNEYDIVKRIIMGF